MKSGKPVAAICHGPQILTAAGERAAAMKRTEIQQANHRNEREVFFPVRFLDWPLRLHF